MARLPHRSASGFEKHSRLRNSDNMSVQILQLVASFLEASWSLSCLAIQNIETRPHGGTQLGAGFSHYWPALKVSGDEPQKACGLHKLLNQHSWRVVCLTIECLTCVTRYCTMCSAHIMRVLWVDQTAVRTGWATSGSLGEAVRLARQAFRKQKRWFVGPLNGPN